MYNVNTEQSKTMTLYNSGRWGEMNTMISFRTNKELKEKATQLFDSMGMTLSTALNLFMTQAVLKNRFPCSLDVEVNVDTIKSYPNTFFQLFGAGANLGLDEEPEEIAWDGKDIVL